MDENKLYMPQGLPVNPIGPEWVGDLWPLSILDSSIGSVIMVIGICLGIAVAAFILSFIAKTFLPKVLNKMGQYLLILVGLAGLVGIGFTFMSWSAEDSISDVPLGQQVTRVIDWSNTKGVTMDLQSGWDLVCGYYDEKNSHCRDTHPTVQYKGVSKEVRLERVSEGNVVLYDFEELIPFVQ